MKTQNSRIAPCLFSAGTVGDKKGTAAFGALPPSGTNRPGVCETRSLGLDPGCLPFGGCSYTELEHYKKQRPRESCLLRITAFLWEGQVIIWGASACLDKPVSWSLDSGPRWVTLCKALSLSSCICKMGIIMLCFN